MNKDHLLEELYQRRAHAERMGGEERVAKQEARGKKTARERIAMLVDRGSFTEYGQLATHESERGYAQSVEEVSAADGVVCGVAKINGKPAVVVAEDFTVKAGTYGIVHGQKKRRMVRLALQERLPAVWLLDGAGARAQEMIGEGLPEGINYLLMAELSGTAPQVAIVMGPSAGDSSLIAALTQFIIMVRPLAMLAAGGPPIVKAATGQEISKEDLGGADIHCRISGVADNAVETEEEAIVLAKRFLSYLPVNAWEYPPRLDTGDPPDRPCDDLLDIVPGDPRSPYDMKKVICSVADGESFFEIKPDHAQEIIVGFARMDGHPVGFVANQPMVGAGSITTAAARKARHFIDMCNAYHVTLVFLQDVPGLMPGPQSEREGALRAGLALTYSLAWAEVPRVTVVIRKAFGYGACAMAGAGAGQSVVLAWPGADFGSLPPTSAILSAHARELDAAEDREALMKELLERYQKCSGAFQAAQVFNIDDVIDPRETRMRINRALEMSRLRRSVPARPPMRAGVMP